MKRGCAVNVIILFSVTIAAVLFVLAVSGVFRQSGGVSLYAAEATEGPADETAPGTSEETLSPSEGSSPAVGTGSPETTSEAEETFTPKPSEDPGGSPSDQPTEQPTEPPTEPPTEAPTATPAPAVTLHVQEPTDADALSERIAASGSVASVEIDDGTVSNEDLAVLLAAFPDVSFRYAVKLGDAYVPCDAAELNLSGTKIADPESLKRIIALLPELDRVEMIGCGLDNGASAELCDAFPGIRFIWEIDLGYWGKLRTDATAFSTRYQRSEAADKHRMTSEQVQYIRYCTDLIALDLGHQKLTDITFLRPLKKLRVLILADNYISEIGVLAELSELEYIELFMNRITDLSPLENLAYLHDLNVCSNKISDFKPVCAIKTLERFWYAKNNATSKDHKMLQEALPDCVLNHTDTGTDGGWRFSDKNKKERSEREKWKNAFFEGAPRYT